MLNSMERTLEKQLPESDRRWSQPSVREDGENHGASPRGFPEPRTLRPAQLHKLEGNDLYPSCFQLSAFSFELRTQRCTPQRLRRALISNCKENQHEP